MLRLFGGAIAAAAVPGLRPGLARAGRSAVTPRTLRVGCNDKSGPVVVCSQGTTCGFEKSVGGFLTCNKGCCIGAPGELRTVCCARDGGSNCCMKGFTCGSGKNTPNDPNCRCDGYVNPDGTCVPCAQYVHRCGTKCCDEKVEYCADKKHGLCCRTAEEGCMPTGRAGKGACCSGADTCCPGKDKAACCGPEQTCNRGVCGCPKAQPVKCLDRCCEKRPCCGNKCGCKHGEFCITTQGKKVCCPEKRIAQPGFCCPPGMVADAAGDGCCPTGNPDCCGGDLGCLGKQICVGGTCVPR